MIRFSSPSTAGKHNTASYKGMLTKMTVTGSDHLGAKSLEKWLNAPLEGTVLLHVVCIVRGTRYGTSRPTKTSSMIRDSPPVTLPVSPSTTVNTKTLSVGVSLKLTPSSIQLSVQLRSPITEEATLCDYSLVMDTHDNSLRNREILHNWGGSHHTCNKPTVFPRLIGR